MKFITGVLFKTLSRRVNKEIKESLYQNEVFLRSRWNVIERNIVPWSSRYLKYTALVTIMFLLIVANLIFWQPWAKSFAVEYLPHWRRLLEWQGGFLAGQLTIVGVVYPLVIGLISILFQNKSAKKTIFPIYQKCSGFMFAGLSGLTLSVFIVFGYFLRVYLDDATYAAFCVTSALWLASNISLTAWFFIQTFRMLDERSRDRLVLQFSIHESCEFDIRERIQQVLIDNAVGNNLLKNPDEHTLSVQCYKYSDGDYGEITRAVAHNKVIKDIRYGLINIATKLQLTILKIKKTEGCTIVVQPLRNSRNSKNIVLAKYDGFKINPLSKLLIKCAFSFKNENIYSGIGLGAILDGFVGSASDALRDGNAKDFTEAVKNIADWHTEIALALSFKNDEGDHDNWLLLPSNAFWGRSCFDELLSEYFRLARETVEKIPDNSSFYNNMLYLHKNIYAGRDELVKREARSLIQGSYHLWYLLMEWRSYSSDSGDLRIANKYEDILYDFVGSWESWLMYIVPRSKRSGYIEKSYPAFIAHLEFTASTAISALRFNNYEAAGWGVDMLNNWLGNLSSDEYFYAEYSWRSVLLNHCHLKTNPDDTAWQFILKGNDYDPLVAFDLTFKNTSFDLRILTACYMLLKPVQDQKELLADFVRALLSGALIHKTGSIDRSHHSVISAGDLLGAFIRQRDYRRYGEGSYSTWLSSVLDSFGRIYEERRVSGRIYSGWGANDPRRMNKAYVEIAISLSSQKWCLSNDWEEAILSNAFRHVDRESIVSDLRDWIKIAQEERSYLLLGKEAKGELISNFCESITEIIDRIEKTLSDDVVGAEIDRERLRAFGIAGSVIFKNTDKPSFPLSLFGRMGYEDEVEDSLSYVLNIIDYSKQRVALGVEINRAFNEDEWMADNISRNVKINVLRKLLSYQISDSYKYKTIDSFLSDIAKLANSLACPVLFVGSRAISIYLRQSAHDRDISDKYDISRSDGFDNEYICHIGRCEVYNVKFRDVDYCLLSTKELFDEVTFKKVANNQFVEADFIPNEDNESIGKLQLKYWMDVELAENIPCIKLELEVDEGGRDRPPSRGQRVRSTVDVLW